MDKIKNYECMSVQEKWNALAMVANLYYNSDLTQNQIAERMYTSRSKISRMLKEARKLGIVEVYVHEPWERGLEQEKVIQDKFNIRNIRVIIQRRAGNEKADSLIEATAYYLDSVIRKDMTVGISWGDTLHSIVKYVAANNHKNIPITVVPIMGAANVSRPDRDGLGLSKDLASAYGGKYQYIYAPLFVKNKELREELIQEENIQAAIKVAESADLILTSVGSISARSWGYFLSEKSIEVLAKKGAVGHIGGHFFDIDGNETSISLNDRMIGLKNEDIKKCKDTICVAKGAIKADAILGALRGDYIDTLIIDEECANRVIEMI